MELVFPISSWSAWAPSLRTVDEWLRWAGTEAPLPGSIPGSGAGGAEKAPVGFLPPAFRRRCSRIARAALAVANSALPKECQATTEMVFASRHGEAELTLDLLRSLAADELLSPTDFGLSVHNAASGLYSIATGNREQCTALAAGPNTLYSSLVELSLRAPAALVYADEPLPEVFRTEPDDSFPHFAFALVSGALVSTPLTSSASTSGEDAQIHAHCTYGSKPYCGEPTPHPEAPFLRWLFCGTEPLILHASGATWTFTYQPTSPPPLSLFREVQP